MPLTAMLERLLGILRHFGSPEQIRADLAEFEEPSPELASMIEGTLRHAPKLLNKWFASQAKEFADLQETPKGRQPAIPIDEYDSVCNEISALERNGYSNPQAKTAVAKRRGVSSRSIHRIWKKRSEHLGEGVTMQHTSVFVSSIFRQGPTQPDRESNAAKPLHGSKLHPADFRAD